MIPHRNIPPGDTPAVRALLCETFAHLGATGALDVKIEWNRRLTIALGQSRFQTVDGKQTYRINLNPRIYARATAEDRFQNVIHEVCHVVAWMRGGRGHGAMWQRLMEQCGLEPRRCHQVDVVGVRGRVQVTCGCVPPRAITVKESVHRKILAGERYDCRRCNKQIRPMQNDVDLQE